MYSKFEGGAIKKRLAILLFLAMSMSAIPAYSFTSQEANVLYQQACSAEYQHNYNDVVEKLTKAIQIVGDNATLYTKLAGAYSELGQYDKALEAYQKVTQLNPNDAFIYISIGSLYENKSDYQQALNAYNKAVELFPDYKYNYLNIANAQYQLKDYKSAIDSYNKFLSVYSKHVEARENLASSYLGNNQSDKAVSEFETLYNSNTAEFKEYVNYGIALYKTKNYEKSAEILEKGMDANNDNVMAHVTLALDYQELEKNEMALAQYKVIFKMQPDLNGMRFDYANLLADMDKNTEAIEQFNLYLKYYPENYIAYKNLGIVYKKMNNIDLAIFNYEKAIAKNSEDVDLKKNLAEAYHLKKDYSNAVKYYDQVLLVKKDDYNVKYNKAIALHAMKKYDDAITIYSELLKVKDNDSVKNNLASALLAQGQNYLTEKNYTKAADYFDRAIKGGTTDSYAFYGLAKCYRVAKDNDKAAQYYEKAISLSPEMSLYSNEYAEFIASTFMPDMNGSGTGALAQAGGNIPAVSLSMDMVNSFNKAEKDQNLQLIKSGDEKFKVQNYDDAIKDYQNALKLYPSDDVTLLKIGNSYKLKNDFKNAVIFYKRAIFVNPNYADGWFNLGLVYADDNDLSGAKESFYRVVNIDPTYSYAYYALAIAYEKEKNKTEALKNYKLFMNYVNNADEATLNSVREKIKTLD